MFAQTALQVPPDHLVSQESQVTKDSQELKGKMAKMVTKYVLDNQPIL